MAFLTAETIRDLIQVCNPPLIDIEIPGNISRYEINLLKEKRKALKTGRIEGSSFDLTLDRVEILDSEDIPLLGKDERIIPAGRDVTAWLMQDPQRPREPKISTCSLLPGSAYLLQSLETINLPPWLTAEVRPRTSTFRVGGIMSCSTIKAGYRGKITVGFQVPQILHIQKGFKFCSVMFAEFRLRDGPSYEQTDPYEGIWGTVTENRTTTKGKPERSY